MEQIIRIRVSAADKAAFEETAKMHGLSLSSWARMVMKDAIRRAGMKGTMAEAHDLAPMPEDVAGL